MSEPYHEFYVENLDDCFSRSDETVTARSALEALEITLWDEIRSVMGDIEIDREYLVSPQLIAVGGDQSYRVQITPVTSYKDEGLQQTISILITKTEIAPDEHDFDEEPVTAGTPDDARLEEVG